MMESQLNILSESLDKKIRILKELQRYSVEQEKVFQDEPVDLEKFDALVDQKDELINQLTRLDDGFEVMYAKLAKELENHRQQYATQIKELQSKVAEVTDISVAVQVQEKRNKKIVEDYFAKERTNIKRGRANSKAAYDYYKNMSGSQYTSPQFYDSKQ